MGLLKFENLPVYPLIGADWKTFNQMTTLWNEDPQYRTKMQITKGLCRLLSLPPRPLERRLRAEFGLGGEALMEALRQSRAQKKCEK